MAPERPADDITITSWLNRLDVEDALGKSTPKATGEQPASSDQDLPDWLKDIGKPAEQAETPKTESDLPEWLRHPISSVEPEEVKLSPLQESAPEPEMPAWVDENIPVEGQTTRTQPEEWIPAEMRATESPEAEPTAGSVPVSETSSASDTLPAAGPTLEAEMATPGEMPEVVEPVAAIEPVHTPAPVTNLTLKQTGMLSHIPPKDKDSELLSNAQDVLDQYSLEEAMGLYSKLIKKGRLLEEVIHDLREAIYRYPVDVIVWQTLGDAYMRANRLQDALDSYTKAEELLR